MKTYATITEATLDTIGRKRKRNEVEHGITFQTIDGIRVVESVRMLHANRGEHNQAVSSDFQTITVNNDRLEDYVNNFLTETPIKFFIGGDFVSQKEELKRCKVRTGVYTYRNVLVKVKHTVLYQEYMIEDFQYNDDNSFNMVLRAV